MTSNVAVVTGSTSGIGRCCAERFLKQGFVVYGLQRSLSVPDGVRAISVDITDEEAVLAAIAQVIAEAKRIDVLVNNAGFGISGAIEFTTLADARRQFDVNVFGMVSVTKAVLPCMRENGGGAIVNLSSIAGILSIPFQAFYSASKSAINALTLALANEVRPFGIRVCALMPGDVKTGFTQARKKDARGAEVYPALERSIRTMEHDEQNGMSPEVLAARVYRLATARAPKPLSSCGLSYRVFAVLQKLLPVRLCNWIVGKMYA